MWSNLPSELLANIFSFLPPDSLASASSVSRHWHACAKAYPLSTTSFERRRHPAWFVAVPTHNRRLACYVHNPIVNTWYELALDFLPEPARPVAPIGSLLLFRPTSCTSLQLAICNPFTRQYRRLPMLNITRTNPAIGIIELGPSQNEPFPHFKVYVAGGMAEAPRGGALYEPTLEMYDSQHNRWQIVGSMPVEFAVRLTVWTPNDSVHCNGVLYWMTSARAYSVMGFDICANTWKELSVPMADSLEFAVLAQRNGKLTLVGGMCRVDAGIWELGEGDTWVLVEKLPVELRMKYLVGKGTWGSTRCVGSDEAVCLYTDLWSGMVVWREVVEKGRWEWCWVEGCCSIRGKKVQNIPIRGVFLLPSLARSVILENGQTIGVQ